MNGKEKVNAWLDEHADETVEFLRELLRIPSVNPYFEDEDSLKREEKAQKYLQKYLDDMGLNIKTWRDIVQTIPLKNVRICMVY